MNTIIIDGTVYCGPGIINGICCFRLINRGKYHFEVQPKGEALIGSVLKYIKNGMALRICGEMHGPIICAEHIEIQPKRG